MTGGASDPHVVPAGVRTVAPVDEDATRVVLVRHGEAQCNVRGVVGGRMGCTGLSERGRQQVAALARRLGGTGELRQAAALASSVLPRAIETAEALAPVIGNGCVPLVTDCALCELHPGEGDGLTWGQFEARFGEPDWDREPDVPLAPGGESWTGFVARAAAGVAAVADRHRGGLVVVACHAGVVEATMLAWLGSGGRPRLGLRTAHTSMTEWERDHRGWRLLRYNDAAHLAEPPLP